MTTIDIGAVVELFADQVTVRVYPESGGRLGQIAVRGNDLLRGPESGAAHGWAYWGSYPLLPWSNRIPHGKFRFEGRDMSVPVNWPDGSAIHGVTADIPWTVTERTATGLVEEVEVDEGPYSVTGRQRFELAPTHLDLTLEVENRGAERVPVGLGLHPWLDAGEIAVPAAMAWPGTPVPDGPARPVTADEDLRTRRMPPPMDRCYTGLVGSSAEVPGLTLSWSDTVTQIVVYTETEGFVCVEPVTMANDGFGMEERGGEGSGVVGLDPGATFSVAYRFTWS